MGFSWRISGMQSLLGCLLVVWVATTLTPAYDMRRDPLLRDKGMTRRSYYGAAQQSGSLSHAYPAQRGLPGGISAASSMSSISSSANSLADICDKLKGKLTSKQVKFCQDHPDFMRSVMLGERDAIKECQHQFKTRRWNCSTPEDSGAFSFRSNQQSLAEIARFDAPNAAQQLMPGLNLTYAKPAALSLASSMQRDSAAPADGNSLDPPHGQKDFKKRKKDKGRLMPAPIVPPGTREQAFVSAISSSGVAHAVTRACSGGMLRECGCDESLRGRSADGFKWSGCSDNIGYGTMFSKSFVDAKDLRVSRRKREKYAKELEQSNGKRKRGTSRRMAPVARALMNLHNNDAGREIIAQNMKVDCKCHGVSGSCEMKTCWRSMPNFREIGEVLKDKFDGASEVRAEMVGNKINLVPRDQGFKPYGKSDLIYINRSPDFCEYNPHRGSLGTHGRQCNKTSKGIDGCDLLCCNRGYRTHVQRVEEQCNCEFKWCCEVRCERCPRNIEIHTCK